MASEFYKKITASCPGSLMIMGEHAVLDGSSAVVAAIDKYLTVELTVESKVNADKSSNFTISTEKDSEKLIFISELDNSNLDANKYFNYILAVINYFKLDLLELNYDYKFNISSQINPNMGFGSSAAITVASIAVILKFLRSIKPDLDNQDNFAILAIGYKIINQVQGKGSGADLAASIYGGILSYTVLDHQVEKLSDHMPLKVLYSGYKLSTSEVIKIVERSQTVVYKKIFHIISELVELGKVYIKAQNWLELGKLFNIHYGMQEALGVSDKILAELVYKLRNDKNIFGAKISGSGLGDCVIGLGDCNMAGLDVRTTDNGLTVI